MKNDERLERRDRPWAYRQASDAVHRLQPGVRQLWRQAVLRRGADVTVESAHRSCLVFAPHPDDETLGCGATIARKRAVGTPVCVLVAADGRYAQKASQVMSARQLGEVRAREVVDACRALGVAAGDVIQLGHEDTQLHRSFDQLAGQLREVILERRPQEILVASRFDHHPDHRTLNRALRAVLPDTPVPYVAEYPVWFWADGPWTDLSSRGTLAKAWHLWTAPLSTLAWRSELVSTDGTLDQKRRALEAHRSQTSNVTGEQVWEVMDSSFLDRFLLPYEVFFPIRCPPSRTVV